MEPNSEIRKGIKTFLTNIPDDIASHNALFNTIEELSKTTNYASNYSLLGSLSSGINTLNSFYNAGSFKSSIPSFIWLYRNVQNPDFLSGLVDSGLFEEISKSEDSKKKVSGLIDSFINSTNKRGAQDRIIAIDKLGEYANTEEKIEKETLLKSMGSLSQIMIYYKEIAKNLNDEDFLNAALSQPEYNFKFIENGNNPLKENEIGLIKRDGKILLKSKLGQKELEFKTEHAELFALTINRELSAAAKTELNNFISSNNFPGVLKHAYKELTHFVQLPANTSEAEVSEAQTAMVNGLVDLATQEHVRKTLIPLANQKLVDDIFNLPQITPAVKEYQKLVSDLAKKDQTKEFQELFGALVGQDPEFKTYISDLMDFLGSPDEPSISDPAYDKSMVSLVDAIKPDVILAAIPLIDSTLMDNILALPKVQNMLDNPETLDQMIEFTEKTQKEFESILGDKSKSKTFSDDEIKALSAILTESEKQTLYTNKPKESKKVQEKIIQTIQGLATNSAACKELETSFQTNKEKVTKALDKLIEHPVAGKTLKDFCLSGAEVADFLPKICNEKGLKATASYVENPSTLNLINIFYQTNTLGFAISHFAKSILKPKEQEKPMTLEKKAEKLKSFSERIKQKPKNKTYAEQVQDSKSAPQIGLTQ